MDRLSLNKNGFTFVEILIVLLIVSILSFGLYSKMHSSLYVFMKQVQTLCITAQQKAYVERRKVYVSIQDSILVDEVIKNYVKGFLFSLFKHKYEDEAYLSSRSWEGTS